MSDESRLREEICRYGRSLFERGLTPGSSGNISLRLPDGGWLVTPTNASLGFLDPAQIQPLGSEIVHDRILGPRVRQHSLHFLLQDHRIRELSSLG